MEENEDDRPESTEESSYTGGEIGTILSVLLRSGQIRLIRNFPDGSFEVSLQRQHRKQKNQEQCRESHGPIDTTILKASQLVNVIEKDSGMYNNNTKKNVTHKVFARERPITKTDMKFSLSDKAAWSRNYLPNTCEIVACYRTKVFCGIHSSDGSVFMAASQARDVGWSIIDAAYSADQQHIIYSSWSDFIHLCDVHGNHDIHLALDLRPTDSRFCAFAICFSGDSKEILAGGSDRCIYIYDMACNERTLKITAHDDDVNAVSFADDSSKILISGGDDGICKVWDRRTLSEANPKPVGMFAGHTDGITYISPKGDGQHFLSNSKDQSIKLWDSRRFSSRDTIQEYRSLVANQSWDYRWDCVPPKVNKRCTSSDALMTYVGHSVLQTLVRARFSPAFTTGQRYIYTGCGSGKVFVYDVLTGEVVTKLEGAHRMCVRDVSWHPYDGSIYSTSWDSTIGRWDYTAPI